MYSFCCGFCRLDWVHVNMMFLCILCIYTESDVRSSFILCSRSNMCIVQLSDRGFKVFNFISMFMTMTLLFIVSY
jgi:hypothetical protein